MMLFWYQLGFLLAAIGISFKVWLSKEVQSWCQKQLRLWKLAAKLPGPPALPFIGNALQFACSRDEMLDRVVDVCRCYHTPFRFWLGPKLIVGLPEPRDINIILNSSNATYKDPVYRFFEQFIGRGLITESGPTHRAHRKVIMPMLFGKGLDTYVQRWRLLCGWCGALHTLNAHRVDIPHPKGLVSKLKFFADLAYVEYFDRGSQCCADHLEEFVDTGEFDVYPFMEHCTLDIILETLMGTPSTVDQGAYEQLAELNTRMYQLSHERMMKLWLHPDWIFACTKYGKEQTAGVKVIQQLTDNLIARKKKEHHALVEGSVKTNGPRLMLLEQLIDHVEKTNLMDDVQLRDEIYTLFTAAQDTTATISSFVFVMLGMHPEIQDKVRVELNEVLGERNITAESLPKLKYLEMVIKETIRLFPIAPFMLRQLRGQVDLETCTLPEGCTVLLAPYLTHRDPKYWENPDKFDPNRFTPENSIGRHSYAYIPFSGGRRSCVGQKYSMMCMKTVVANIVRRYRLTCSSSLDQLRLKTDITIRSMDGYKISITRV